MQKNTLKKNCLSICLFGFILIALSGGYPTDSLALGLGSSPVSTSVTVDPEHPGPYTRVTATFQSFQVDSKRSNITWYNNGEKIAQGVGVEHVVVQTGSAGSVAVVRAVAVSEEGKTVEAQYVLRPGYVGIYWEADTYTPPFYAGKALASPGSTITYTALPLIIDTAGKEIAPEKLYYVWKRNNQAIPDYTGIGKQSITMVDDTYNRSYVVSLDVRSPDNSVTASAKITVPIVQPEVLLYEVHPLLGIRYEHAVEGSYQMTSPETTFIAEPYFFSEKVRSGGNLDYVWQIGAKEVGSSSLLTVRPIISGSGSADIQLTLHHLTQILQSTRKMLHVSFNSASAARSATGGVYGTTTNTYAPF